ncbi:MAG TPA: RsmE family RNA methyltransferase [Candidatus Sulfotelmatobacter sp.]|nr:RsmE family RNA methyltransferase [Candidatus Sulfotelmatobacter sp.]
MTRRRWIADEVSGNRAALTGDHAHHLIRVLRARVGQEFDIVANGVLYNASVDNISEDRVEFELKAEIPAATPAPVTILLSIFKFDRMEWAIEKCTELGVAKIIPVIARRTDSHLASASIKRVDRWRRIAMQASEQSRRIMPPEISEPMKLRDATKIPAETKIVLSESEEQTTLRELLDANRSQSAMLLAIGPEGGWTEDELQLFRENGWSSATLGSTILRAETAAIAAVTIAIQ